MVEPLRLFPVALCLFCLAAGSQPLKIGAFNVRIFGPDKLSRVSVVATLSQVSTGLHLWTVFDSH